MRLLRVLMKTGLVPRYVPLLGSRDSCNKSSDSTRGGDFFWLVYRPSAYNNDYILREVYV